jgi:enoyl-CoA hydratase/carnithine racemase
VSASPPLVAVRLEQAVCVVELRREAKLNALSAALEEALGAALASDAVAQSGAVVLSGGARAFSAGADVSEMRGNDPAAILEYYRRSGDVYEKVAALPQATVAAISGYCLGGGLELALATDVRVAGQGASFGLPEVDIGIVPSSGGLHRLVRAVGPARTRELVLRGRRFDAHEALALGVVHEVVADERVLPRALEIAAELAAKPRLAVTVAKRAIDAAAESSRDAALLIEQLAYGMLAQTHDAAEAASAFVERRPPRFEGR